MAQLAAASFIELLKAVQDPAHQRVSHIGTRSHTLPNWHEAAGQHEQLYDPFEQHGGGTRSQTVSLDGFEALHTGADSSELPTSLHSWRLTTGTVLIDSCMIIAGAHTSDSLTACQLDWKLYVVIKQCSYDCAGLLAESSSGSSCRSAWLLADSASSMQQPANSSGCRHSLGSSGGHCWQKTGLIGAAVQPFGPPTTWS